MRKAGLIAGVVLLAGVFAAVWFMFNPGGGHTTNAPRIADNSTGAIGDDPLDPGDPERAPEESDQPLPGNDIQPGKDPIKGEVTPGERPDPGIKVQPGSKPGKQKPGVKPGSGQTSPPDEEEVPVPPPSVPNPPSQPTPFIKGQPHPPGQNLGNTRPGARKISKPAGVKQLSDVTPKLMQDRRGLYAQYYRMDSPDLAKLDTSTPAMVRIDQTIYFPDAEAFADLPISLDNFAAAWSGYLVIPEAGDYWLFWGADNGGRVELDGETVLLQDGMVRYVEVSTVLTLEPGLHPLKIEFAQMHNNVADWAKCAANFMYVPEGQTKPIPVPPEMLMVPEWMWSNNAPIITSLSKTSGEIGEEITIKGQGFGTAEDNAEEEWKISSTKPPLPFFVYVTFAGRRATILEHTESKLVVKVPIGAKTGDVVVMRIPRAIAAYRENRAPSDFGYPSNSIRFTVTTQFGLMAEWYDLEGWSNFGLEVFGSGVLGDPQVSRIEADAGTAEPPSDITTCAVAWTGQLGLPMAPPDVHGPETDDQPSWLYELRFYSHQPATVTVAGQSVSAEPVELQMEGEPSESQIQYICRAVVEVGAEHYLPLRIELVSPQGAAPAWGLYGWWETPDSGKIYTQSLTGSCLFPPIVPPKPPVISDVKAVWSEGEQPPVQPYDADSSRPSVNVGQQFTFDIRHYGPQEIWDTLPTVTIDGISLAYESEEHPVSEKPGSRLLHCRATMPDGVGEGKMVARLSIVNSEPYYVDITNRGLVAYLYDVPESSGLNELPDLEPLTCFKVRKDRAINFEDTADFDLPFPAETFVIEWLGGLIIEEEGDYEFICRSDDGMKLWLDDNVVIDANHRQAPAENKATVHLVPGTYRFRMQFFENNQHEVCVLEWRATRGEGEAQEEVIPRQVVPAKAFSLDVHPPFPNKSSTGKRTDGS